MLKLLQMRMFWIIHQYSHIRSFFIHLWTLFTDFVLIQVNVALINPYSTCEIQFGSWRFNQGECVFFCIGMFIHVYFLAFLNLFLVEWMFLFLWANASVACIFWNKQICRLNNEFLQIKYIGFVETIGY